jgi:hypothetical protein
VNLETPGVRYARSGDVSIGDQGVGDGPVDVLFVSFRINLVWGYERRKLWLLNKRDESIARRRRGHSEYRRWYERQREGTEVTAGGRAV